MMGGVRVPATYLSAAIYTTVSLLAAAAFLAATISTGDYTWVARLGGAAWVFLLSMIILMPTVTPWVKKRRQMRTEALSTATEARKEEEMWPFGRKTTVKDLVCGMEIDPKKAAGTSIYQGTTYYFCALSCKESFEREPAKYVAGAPAGGH